MKFWVRWDFFIGVLIYPIVGILLLPRIGESLASTAVWIVWGWIVFGGCMLVGNALSRRHPDLGKRVEREDLFPRLFPSHDENHKNHPGDE